MIDWEEGAVCYGGGCYFTESDIEGVLLNCDNITWEVKSVDVLNYNNDFQLNEPSSGYFIPKSELDTEEKYNQAIKVFGLFGHVFGDGVLNCYPDLDKYGNLTICHDGIYCTELTPKWCKVKLTFDQLISIGELKRKMNERDAIQKAIDVVGKVRGSLGKPAVIAADALGGLSKATNSSKPAKKRKAKEAYRILESMGIEWDNVKGKWFKVSKEWL